jgi:hypothetical protein
VFFYFCFPKFCEGTGRNAGGPPQNTAAMSYKNAISFFDRRKRAVGMFCFPIPTEMGRNTPRSSRLPRFCEESARALVFGPAAGPSEKPPLLSVPRKKANHLLEPEGRKGNRCGARAASRQAAPYKGGGLPLQLVFSTTKSRFDTQQRGQCEGLSLRV